MCEYIGNKLPNHALLDKRRIKTNILSNRQSYEFTNHLENIYDNGYYYDRLDNRCNMKSSSIWSLILKLRILHIKHILRIGFLPNNESVSVAFGILESNKIESQLVSAVFGIHQYEINELPYFIGINPAVLKNNRPGEN